MINIKLLAKQRKSRLLNANKTKQNLHLLLNFIPKRKKFSLKAHPLWSSLFMNFQAGNLWLSKTKYSSMNANLTILQNVWSKHSEVYSEPCQRSKIKLFAKISNGFQALFIYVWQSTEYACHCVKSIRIWSFFGPYFLTFGPERFISLL